jgi:hypothetical protein
VDTIARFSLSGACADRSGCSAAAHVRRGFGGQTSLQIFRSVQRQVLTYPHFSVFDSINAQIKDGTVTLTGKVTMPFKRQGDRRGA